MVAVFAAGAVLWVAGGVVMRYQDAVKHPTHDHWHREDMEKWAAELKAANPNITIPPLPDVAEPDKDDTRRGP